MKSIKFSSTIIFANGIFPAGLFLAALFPAGLFPAGLFPAGIFYARAFSRVNYCVNYDKKKCLFNANLIDVVSEILTFFHKSFLKIS